MSLAQRLPLLLLALALAGLAAWAGWRQLLQGDGLPPGFAASNGRIEAVEIEIATPFAGRVAVIEVEEGDFVQPDQVLARMDTEALQARRREAEAALAVAEIAIETADNEGLQRAAELEAARAVVAQREAELQAARKRLARTRNLVPKGTATPAQLDEDEADYAGARAGVSAARAQVAAAEAAVSSARSRVVAARAEVESVRAALARIDVDIEDGLLRSPRPGRVQYRVAEPGEVLPAGGTVLNLADLSDVYMTFFLPTEAAGRVALGAEARIVLDAAPDYVIPASISFVADVAQFTPRTVETAEERQKLSFRLRARIAPALLQRHVRQVKTGLPGMAYVRLDAEQPWPERLRPNVPE